MEPGCVLSCRVADKFISVYSRNGTFTIKTNLIKSKPLVQARVHTCPVGRHSTIFEYKSQKPTQNKSKKQYLPLFGYFTTYRFGVH